MIPHLYTNDLVSTIQYYTNVLRFDLVLRPGELNENSCMLTLGHASIIFEERPSKLDHGRWGKFVFFVDDVSAIFMKVCDFADVRSNLEVTKQGTIEFSVKDCNGVELTFSQVKTFEQANLAGGTLRHEN